MYKVNDQSRVEIKKTLLAILDHFNNLFDKAETILIKPNLMYYWHYTTGETTSPKVVSALIDSIRHIAGNIDIIIGEADASAMKTKYAFEILGYRRLAEEKKVKLVNLSEGKFLEKEVEVDNTKFKISLNELLLNSNLIINVPKLKYHRSVGMSCALKNMFGAISTVEKYKFHENLSKVIVGVNKLLNSQLVIVDGLIALGRFPKKMGLLLASNNPLAADYISSIIMRHNPKRISYIRLATRELGNINGIKLVEENVKLKDARKEFPSYNYLLTNIMWKLQLKTLKIYSTIVGDIIPPILL